MNARAQAQCTPTCSLYRSPFSDENTTGLLGPFCEPFPTGIPDEIWENRFDHRKVYPGQVGEAVWTPSAPGVKFPTYALQVPEDAASASLTAAAAVLEGAMIALVPSQADLQRLATEGGEPADQLHLTLVYLGDAANIDQSTRDALIAWAKDLAPTWDSVEADGFAPALFNPTGEEPCLTLVCSGADLAEMHETVLADVSDALELPDQHLPFIPHVTLMYYSGVVDGHVIAQDSMHSVDLGQISDRAGPIVFDRIRLAFAGEVTDVPFGSVGSAPEPVAVVEPQAQTAAATGPIREVWDGPLH